MNILVISPIYPSVDAPKQVTPVVHYFTREWVKDGHKVQVVHCPSNFPQYLYLLARPFQQYLSARLYGFIRMYPLSKDCYNYEGVDVLRLPLKKTKPHSAYSSKQIRQLVVEAISYCKEHNFIPDTIVGHWFMPAFEIVPKLKQGFGKTNIKTALVLHDYGGMFLDKVYMEGWKETLNSYDILGYRSDAIKRAFETKIFKWEKDWFYCNSGVPEQTAYGNLPQRDWRSISKCIYVGELIKRKYPAIVASALIKVFPDYNFDLTYIGLGFEEQEIKKIVKESGVNNIHLLGRIPREEVFCKMQESDVFIMISRGETFGLVYLEAMAQGCLTIASYDEGFDGIIQDGVNGFLCKAGDEENLIQILHKIQEMSPKERQRISEAAKQTAIELTDKNVANKYIESII